MNPTHETHIRRVEVNFEISAPFLDPGRVTSAIGITPDACAHPGERRQNYSGQDLPASDIGWWRWGTKDRVESKDINDHFSYLLAKLISKKDTIVELSDDMETLFDVLWESTYLYAGTGPIISRKNITGIASLNAEIGFDIYAIEEEEA